MGHFIFDLTNPEMSYLMGFILADGHMEGDPEGKGRISVELSYRDRHLLEQFQAILPVYSSIGDRTRDTNFKDEYHSATWRVCNMDLRRALFDLGLPYGKKSRKVQPPDDPYIKRDFFRGIIDGDGSVGSTSNGIPFVSHGATSRGMADALLGYIHETIGIKKTCSPNKRDGAYNIAVFKELAQKLATDLYYPGCMALDRKRDAAQAIQSWVRPVAMRYRGPTNFWDDASDHVVLTNSVADAARALNRTEASIRSRLWRLRPVAVIKGED